MMNNDSEFMHCKAEIVHMELSIYIPYILCGNFHCKSILVVAINHENIITQNYFYTSE